ncbi:MAG: DUF1800 domain-containing protein [Bacteroidota bacterium]
MGKNTVTQMVTGLAPYTGEWTFAQAAHLLRRTTFGPNKDDISTAVDQGLAAAIQALVVDFPEHPLPVYYDYDEHPDVPLGSSWVDAHYVNVAAERGPRNRSYRSWLLQQMMDDKTIREKMTLFWQNHFGVTFNGDPLVRYAYNALLRTHANGNFRTLLKEVTIHPAMLAFLNGNENSRNSPNENYGRELLELFSIGKGPQIGPGDYSNYTEDDVRELARALTGWVLRNNYPTDPAVRPNSLFIPNRHDTTTKQLSYHFDNRIIENGDDQEYATVVDIILEQLEVARYICRKLYRFFVYYDISPTEEAEVIEPLAQLFYDSDYDLQVVLTNLLSSQHFFDSLNQGPMIKTPFDFGLSMFRGLGMDHIPAEEFAAKSTFNLRILGRFSTMGMDYLSPPSVSGWEAWYQAPVFTRSWINSSTLQERTKLSEQFTGNGFSVMGVRFRFQFVEWIEQLDNPLDPNALVAEIAQLFLPQPLVQAQLDALKEILIPGLPDFEWTDEYGLYLTNPSDAMLYSAIESKLKSLFRAVFGLAEFHLS